MASTLLRLITRTSTVKLLIRSHTTIEMTPMLTESESINKISILQGKEACLEDTDLSLVLMENEAMMKQSRRGSK